MAVYELFRGKFENPIEKEKKRFRLKEAAISTRSALRFVAYDARKTDIAGKIKTKKNTHRGLIYIQIEPEKPAIASWIQHETASDYLSLVRYRLAIGIDGSMQASRQTLRRTMNEVPLVKPMAFRLGGFTVGIGPKFAHIDTRAHDALEKGLDPDKIPQPFVPSIEFLESLKRDILREPFKPSSSQKTI